MAIDEEFVRNALKNVKYPGCSRDIVSFGMVKDILLEGKSCTVTLGLTASNPWVSEGIQNMCEAVLRTAEILRKRLA